MSGRVEAIHLAEKTGGPTFAVSEVEALANEGLAGDRIVLEARAESRDVLAKKQVTFIEQEALDALARDYGVELSAAASRRNVCTRGAALNHLVGRLFNVGGAVLRGVELCEPCGTLERLSGAKGALKGLIHRGGLRAEVVTGGTIRIGDEIEEI
jgi:MOSC domain-containing protein YiiM